MVDVVLPRLEDFFGPNVGRHMSDHFQTMGVGGTVDREVRGAILDGTNLQEIELFRGQYPYDPRRLVGVADRDPDPLEGLDALLRGIFAHSGDVARRLEVGPGDQHARADPASRIHLAAPLQQLLVIATGVPNRRDAVGHEQAHRRGTRFREVRVHLDKPGTTKRPRPSTMRAPCGTSVCDAGPTSAMRSPRMTTVASDIGGAPVTGITVAPWIAITPDDGCG